MAQSLDACGVPALEQRRCLLLAAIGLTAETMPNNQTLVSLLSSGLLVTIKLWLAEIIDGKLGGVDLLLHLLSMITPLPVTKDMVTSSRLGKAVSAIEKDKICVGTKNEAAIKNRISEVKSRWSASVKAQKSKSASGGNNAPVKRQTAEETSAPPPAKKAKVEAPRASSLSSLLKKVENSNGKGIPVKPASKPKQSFTIPKTSDLKENNGTKKEGRRIHWADSNGGALTSEEKASTAAAAAAAEQPRKRKSRWADSSKKKDLMHEKEMLMLARSKKANAPVDDDKEEQLNAMAMLAMWKAPQSLPEDTVNPPVHVNSNEVAVQTNRMSAIPAVTYSDESQVPISPALLDEVEKALEFTSRNTVAPTEIPFFTPKAPPSVDFLANLPPPPVAQAFPPPPPPAQLPAGGTSSEATLETVLMMGLPLFLVGQNLQALQTLQASPGLLDAYKDSNGVYNQAGLISLVQTLTQNAAPQASQNPYAAYQPMSFQQQIPQPAAPRSTAGYRGDQNNGDANMHLSGYGPTTTVEEIINLFSPYVHVVEVVTKDRFSFVNTNDSEGAKRAREALNGALLGGMPCRINPATRKSKNPNHTPGSTGTGASVSVSTLPRNALGQVDYDQVRDDRGNAATRNLFVAGYGPGTTDQQLRDIVSPYANVLSVTNKGTFAFVNTDSRESAILARASLTGQQLNGSLLRINFAKETGRLGTSFAAASAHGHYGR
mmetsp:Transcript_52/g.118  ORF Transcript_52/g.118 Transcript_52/m.118 type:complete len:717 (+) Transcript_52:1094-3244(+)